MTNPTLGVGIIGCGSVSETYLNLAPMFQHITVKAVADLRPEAAETRAQQYGVRAQSVEDLLCCDDIDIVVNLTVPSAHFDVSAQILKSGKHVYSEKPFVLSVESGDKLLRIANKTGRRVGSAPDTFLGGSHQLARYIVDKKYIGPIHSGTCHVMSNGMESWHPNPDFFYKPGGGPILDLGPYYLTNLVQLLGPVSRVGALTGMAHEERVISSQPRLGERITVETPTTIHALLEFESGAMVTLSASWDVLSHRHSNMELYGSQGTLYVPDPNLFGGELEARGLNNEKMTFPDWQHPFQVNNQHNENAGSFADYRVAGLAEMANAILKGKPHRCSDQLAFHVVEIMTAILKSGEQGKFLKLQTTCARPEPFSAEDAQNLLR